MAKRNISVEKGRYIPASMRGVELVERKGLAHPDTLIDGIMENISMELCGEYIRQFGKILHHNVDKGQICGGGAEVHFGGGRVVKPIFVLLSGRATDEAEGRKIPTQEIAVRAARDYMKRTVRNLDVSSGVEIQSRISPGSAALVDLFLRGPAVQFSNDTSFGTGFAPFTDLERLVLETERFLNSADYKSAHPETGEDIKVMGFREKGRITLTVSCAFVSKYVCGIDDYVKYKERVRDDISKLAARVTGMETEVAVNTADDVKHGSVYLTLTGTSAEMGDDGSVGRGNRANGLITPFRNMTLEATAGKNPVNHVGKIYSVLANEMAGAIVAENDGIEDITITLLSQIGKPIDRPKVASATVLMKKGGDYRKAKSRIRYAMDQRLENITEVTNRIVEGKAGLF